MAGLCQWVAAVAGCGFLALGSLARAGDTPEISLEAAPVLERFVTFYQKAEAFAVNARQIRRVDGVEDTDSSMQVVARKPNEARIQIMAPQAVITFVSDGKRLIVHQSPPNTWVTRMGTVSIPELTENMLTGLESLAAADVRASVLESVEAIRISGTAKVAGKPCWVLEFRQSACVVDCWITQDPHPTLARLRLRAQEEGRTIEMETTYSGWDFTPQIIPETFQFHPPGDAEEGGTVSARPAWR